MSEKVRISVTAKHAVSGLYARPADTDRDMLVVMAHTFPDSHMSGHHDLFGRIENALVHEGFHTLRFDFRGCGASDGAPEHMTLGSAGQDLSAVLDWAKGKEYRKFIVLAEGLAATVAMTRLSEDVQALILLWPVLDPKELAGRRFGAAGYGGDFSGSAPVEIDGHKVGLTLIGEMWNTDLTRFFRRVKMPVLILHGAQDDIAPIEQLDLARSCFRTSRIEITSYHDGTHGLPQASHRKYAYYHILQFLKKYA